MVDVAAPPSRSLATPGFSSESDPRPYFRHGASVATAPVGVGGAEDELRPRELAEGGARHMALV